MEARIMRYALQVDDHNLLIQGVQFDTPENYAIMKDSLGSSMYEGLEPTTEMIELLRDVQVRKKNKADILTFVLGKTS